MTAAAYESIKLTKLCAAYRRLHLGRFEIITKMRINVLMIVAEGKLAVTAIKSVAAKIINTRRADAIPAPVTH